MVTEEKRSNKDPSQATKLILLAGKLGLKPFHDQSHTPFALVNENGQRVVWPTSNRNLKRWLAYKYHQVYGEAPNQDAIRQAINVLEGQACFEGEQIYLHNRVAWDGDALYYDLADRCGRAVKVTQEGWSVVEDTPVLFRRYEHQEAQVEPDPHGDISLLIPFLNLKNEEQIPLELAYLITCFIPGIPHPIHISHGPQGAAKSTVDRIKRRLVDPSVNDIQTLTSRVDQTVQTLAQNWLCAFDNVSHMNEEISDLLSRAATGASYSKRALYTDDETVIHKLGCCVSLNGINVVVNKPDLMDRCILIEYARISKTRRKEEKEILTNFEALRPKILGGICDVLAYAIRIKPTIRTSSMERMADFTLWGMAVCQAMGYGAETFLRLYRTNIARQHEEIVNSDSVGLALLELMADNNRWSGTPSELLSELNSRCDSLSMDKRTGGWPKAPHALTRRIKQLETTLAALGYRVLYGDDHRTSKARQITIVKDDSGQNR